MSTTNVLTKVQGPHAAQPVLQSGAPLSTAKAAGILLHGRGADAADILALAEEFRVPGVAYLAPHAAGSTWYPYSFLAPLANNEPYLSSALSVIESLQAFLQEQDFPPERTFLLGFSQGACLTLEFAARHAQRYGAVVGLSGGLIGPDGTPRKDAGNFSGTPVFLGCSDVDPHIPKARVEESAELLKSLGAEVTLKLYRGLGHTVNADEIRHVRTLLQSIRGV